MANYFAPAAGFPPTGSLVDALGRGACAPIVPLGDDAAPAVFDLKSPWAEGVHAATQSKPKSAMIFIGPERGRWGFVASGGLTMWPGQNQTTRA